MHDDNDWDELLAFLILDEAGMVSPQKAAAWMFLGALSLLLWHHFG